MAVRRGGPSTTASDRAPWDFWAEYGRILRERETLMHVENFELSRPIALFDAVWDAKELSQIPSDEEHIQVGDTFDFVNVDVPFPPFKIPYPKSTDIWGIDWSMLSPDAWNPSIPKCYQQIGKYRIAYLRFELTIYNGRPSDAMLFLFNQPTTPTEAGVHAQVHLEIDSESESMEARRSTAVEQHLVRGYSEISDFDDGDKALEWMREQTLVRFLGLSKEEGIRVQCRCSLLGGMY